MLNRLLPWVPVALCVFGLTPLVCPAAELEPLGDESTDWGVVMFNAAIGSADLVVLGIATEVDTVHVECGERTSTPSFVSLEVAEVVLGQYDADSLTFYSWCPMLPGPRSERGMDSWGRIAVGDTVFVWMSADRNAELNSNRGYVLKDGPRGWTMAQEGDYLGIPRHAFDDYVAHARDFVRERSMERLYIESEAVVVGFVRALTYRGSPNDHEFHDATVSVRYDFKDSVADSVLLLTLPLHASWFGGYHDIVQLEPGELGLLFLDRDEGGRYRIRGGRDGAYLVEPYDRLVPAKNRGAKPGRGLPCRLQGRATVYKEDTVRRGSQRVFKALLVDIEGHGHERELAETGHPLCWREEVAEPVEVTDAYFHEDGRTSVVRLTDAKGCEFVLCRDGRPSTGCLWRCVYIGAEYPTEPGALVLDPDLELAHDLGLALTKWANDRFTPRFLEALRDSESTEARTPEGVRARSVFDVARGLSTRVCPFGAASNWRLQPPVLSVTPAADAPGAPD